MEDSGGYVAYLAPVVGTRIIGVDEGDGNVSLFLDDGTVLDIYAEDNGGFSAEIRHPKQAH